MALTNYPNGLASFGIPLLGSLGAELFTGRVFYVHGTTGLNTPGRGSAPDTPYATIAYAMSQTRAAYGDVIICLPGHAESVIAAGTITCDKSGVTVLGVGNGALRPTITWSTVTGATVTVSAANVTFRNFIFNGAGVDAVAALFTVTGANFTMDQCYMVQGDATNQAVLGVSLGTGADGARITRSRFQSRTAGATAFINTLVAVDRLEVTDCVFDGDTTAHIRNATVACTNALISRNHFYCLGSAKSVIADAAATGFVTDNYSLITANIAAGGSMTAAGMAKAQNYAVESAQVATSAIVDPAATGIA